MHVLQTPSWGGESILLTFRLIGGGSFKFFKTRAFLCIRGILFSHGVSLTDAAFSAGAYFYQILNRRFTIIHKTH